MSQYAANFCSINCASASTHPVPDTCNKFVRTSCADRLISIYCPSSLALLNGLKGVPLNSTTSINTPAAIATNMNALATGGALAPAMAVQGVLEQLPENTYNTLEVSGCSTMDIYGETSLTFTIRADWDAVAATATTPYRSGITQLRDYYMLNQPKFSAWAFVDCNNDVFAFINPSTANTATSTNPADYFAKGTVTADILTEKVGNECVQYLKVTVKFRNGAVKSQPLFNLTMHPTATFIYNNWQAA